MCRASLRTIARGEHGVSTSPSLDELDRVFAAGSACVVDLTDADFIDSTVLKALAYGSRVGG